METKVLQPTEAALAEAAELLRAGQLVAFPTETVYGLGADALNADAVRAIFAAKGRPADNPLIVHIWDRSQLDALCEPTETALQLMDRFWPGPLTVLCRKKQAVPEVVTAGLDTVGMRMPSHPVARAMLKAAGVPVAAPSANLSTRPSPTTAAHVLEDMDGRIPLILDGGACEVGVESTVIDVSGPEPRVLRPGGVTPEMIEAVFECAYVTGAAAAASRNPDTIKRTDASDRVKETIDRENTWLVQTPQIFKADIYRAASYLGERDHVTATDDCALCERLGFPVHLVDCGPTNMKITYPADVVIAEAILKSREAVT